LPSDIVALIVPETPSELFQLKVAALAPDGVDPVPVPIVVQPAAMATSSGNINAAFRYLISILLFMSIRKIASISTGSMAAENHFSISCLARDIADETRRQSSAPCGLTAVAYNISRGSVAAEPLRYRPFLWRRCPDEEQRFAHCDQNCCNKG
jgi:hypothetical protein